MKLGKTALIFAGGTPKGASEIGKTALIFAGGDPPTPARAAVLFTIAVYLTAV